MKKHWKHFRKQAKGPEPTAVSKYRNYLIGRFADPTGAPGSVWCIRPEMDDDGIVGFVVSDGAFRSMKAARAAVDNSFDGCPDCPPQPGEPRRGTDAWLRWCCKRYDVDGLEQVPCPQCGQWFVWLPVLDPPRCRASGPPTREEMIRELIVSRAIARDVAARVVDQDWPLIAAWRKAWKERRKPVLLPGQKGIH